MLNIKINISGGSSCLNNFLNALDSIKLWTVEFEMHGGKKRSLLYRRIAVKSIKIQFQARM